MIKDLLLYIFNIKYYLDNNLISPDREKLNMNVMISQIRNINIKNFIGL